MEFIKKYKNIVLSVVIIAIAAAGYTILFGKDGAGTALLTSQRSDADVIGVGEDVLDLLRQLRLIELDGTIFEDPAFQSLEDFSQELIPEPVGRDNPFAPIGEGGGSRTTSF